MHRTAAPLILLTLLAALVPAATAGASSTQESIVQDDHLLLYSSPAKRDAALTELAALGADTIRALVIWDRVAPGAGSVHRPAGFDAADPAAYGGAWAPYVALENAAAAHGLSLLLTPTGPGPAWASACRGSAAARRPCRPRPSEFRDFVSALAKHFPGQHRWAMYNEPNVGSWLSPQFVGGRLVSADLYRSLVRAGIAGLRQAGHGSDAVLIGETAPSSVRGGSSARSSSTLAFVDRLLCMTASGRRLSSGGCRGPFAKLGVAGFATHPYVRGGSRPPSTPAKPGEVTIGSLSRLTGRLDRAARLGRIPRELPVFLTEHGFQTRPPERLLGVSLTAQAADINESDWIAFRNPRVRSVAQYLLNDDGPVRGFQSGLRFVSGRAKPSLAAYRLPLWVRARGSSVTVFGQVRPAADSARETVLIQSKPLGRGFRTVKRVTVTNRKGYFTVNLRKRAGLWRLSWTPSSGGRTLLSRAAGASRR